MADDPYAAAVTTTTPAVDPYAAAVKSDPYATGGPGAITPPTSPGFFGAPTNAAQKAAVKATTDFGNFMAAGHKNPVGAFLSKTQGGQRMLQAIAAQVSPLTPDPASIDPFKALMDPTTAPAMQLAGDKAMGIDPQGPVTQALGGNSTNLPQKLARGAVHTVADAVTSPASYVAPAKVAGAIADVIPGANAAIGAASKAIGNSKLGAMFNPDYYLRGLTDQGKALYESITNKAMETVRAQKQAEDAIVKKFAPEIRAGQMPPEVASLFTADKGQAADTAWRKYFPDGLSVGQNPADVQMALYSNRAPVFKSLAMPELQKHGFFTTSSGVAAGRSMGSPDLFDIPTEGLGNAPAQVTNATAPHPIHELQKRLEANLEQPAAPKNTLDAIAQGLTQRGNQAFLANPVPHVGNLADLLKNRYGYGALAQGLVNAARVATGTVGQRTVKETPEAAQSPAFNLFRYQANAGEPILNADKGGVFYGVGDAATGPANYKLGGAGRTLANGGTTGPGGSNLFQTSLAPNNPLTLAAEDGHVGQRVLDHLFGPGAGNAVKKAINPNLSMDQVPPQGMDILRQLGLPSDPASAEFGTFLGSHSGVGERLDAVGIQAAKNAGHDAIYAPKATPGKVNEFVDLGAPKARPAASPSKPGSRLADTIAQLEAGGAKSQYANIFNELGFTGMKNLSPDTPFGNLINNTVAPATRAVASGVNKVVVPLQRASNAAQNAILNPAETGFRAAALDAENAAGTDPLQALKNVHATFGTNAPNQASDFLTSKAVPFAKFHYQTAPGSVLRTLANNPGRVVNTVQAERDYNNAVNPAGPKYMSTVPSAQAARMLADPLGYFGNAGGVLGMEGPYSVLTNAKNGGKGMVKAAGSAISKFTPGSEPGVDASKVAIDAFNQMLNHGPPTDYRPLFNAVFGGYDKR